MRYAHILAAVSEERWAIERSKLQAMLDFLSDQASGVKLSDDMRADRIGGRAHREPPRRDGSIAILPLRGVIANRMNMMTEISGGTSNEGFGRMFDALVADPQVKAIVIDTDSPGGAVSGSAELSSKIYEARGTKPIVAHVNATAASAAYWIASAADEVVVTPTGVVGSIGVFAVHEDISGALDKAGVRKTIVSAGEFKASGNPFEPLGDETRMRMQARIDGAYDMFVSDVARNRGVDADRVRRGYGRGDVLDARSALAEGMVDRIETLEETVRRLGATNTANAARPKFPERHRRSAMMDREVRTAQAKLDLISDDEIVELHGVATVFGPIAQLDRLTRLLPSAFRSDLCPKLLREHDFQRTLAPEGRISLMPRRDALEFRCRLLPDAYGLLVLEALEAGLRQCSVGLSGFGKAYTEQRGGRLVRVVQQSGLAEISLVRAGAFPGTSAGLVSLCGKSLDDSIALFKTRAVARRSNADSSKAKPALERVS